MAPDPAAPAFVGSGSGSGRAVKVATLKRRAEFLRVRGGGRWAGPAFVLEGKARSEDCDVTGPRFGFTVTKKLGGAVVRNRIRRRLKAAVQAVADQAAPRYDYVVVARQAALDRDFQELKTEMTRALARVASDRRDGRSAPK